MIKLTGKSKLFKTGNSFGLRLTKNDKELLHANPGDEFEKVFHQMVRLLLFTKNKRLVTRLKR